METNFNFKSQVCTDKVQSERLLALGLKKETADCHWFYTGSLFGWQSSTQTYMEAIECASGTNWTEDGSIIPAWSLHRLIEMMPENVSDDWLGVSFDEVSYYHGEGEDMIGWKYYKVGNIYDCIIECYEWLIKKGYFPKEYLV